MKRGLTSLLICCLAAGATIVLASCAKAETADAPDAALPPCKTGPAIFCQAVTDATPSCSTDAPDSPHLRLLPPGTRYALGCVVNYVGDRDDQGDCRLDAVCKCVTPSGGGSGPPQWFCSP